MIDFLCINVVSSSGGIIYSEVQIFLKRQPDIVTKYMSITTAANITLTLTGNHLVYSRTFFSDEFQPM